MYQRFIARRYLFSRIITFAALVVVASSVALLIIIVSIMEGFRSELQARVRGISSDMKVESTRNIGLRDAEKLADRLARLPGVRATAPYVETPVFFSLRADGMGGDDVDHRVLRAVDLDRELKVGDLSRYIEDIDPSFSWLPKDPKVLFSREWAAKLSRKQVMAEDPTPPLRPEEVPPPILMGQEASRRHISPGEIVRLTAYSPRADTPVTGEFIVAGYFKTGLYEIDSMAMLMELSVARSFLRLEKADGSSLASGVRIDLEPGLDDLDELPRIEAEVEKLLVEAQVPFARILTWREEKALLLGAVQVEKFIMSLILGVIILFSGLMMFIILTLITVEKTRDLGVLQSIGATPRAVASIFLRIGATLCTLGTILGAVYGVGFAASVNTIQRWIKLLTGLEVFPPSVYYLDRIPVRFQPFDLLLIIVPTVLVSLFATLIPAWRAARKDPVVALRYE